MLIERFQIWLGISFFLLILVILFRKSIKLNMIGLAYGQYSYPYLNAYKKYFVKSPFQYCFRDDFVAHIHYVLSKKEKVPCYKSVKDIYFENTPYYTNYKDFLNKKGKPDCFNAFLFDPIGFEIKVLGYQSAISGSKAIVVFYFMNDSFFMGEYIFKNPKTDIKASVGGHFLESKVMVENNFYIENSKNRIIHFHKTGFSVDIKYLNKENEAIINNLKEYYLFTTGKSLVVEP